MSINVKYEAAAVNVEAIAGDTFNGVPIKFIDTAGDPYDISALDFYYTVKSSFNVSDTDGVINKLPVDAIKSDSGGGTVDTVAFPLTATEMEIPARNYVHAIKMVNGAEERTWVSGSFIVTQRKIDTV